MRTRRTKKLFGMFVPYERNKQQNTWIFIFIFHCFLSFLIYLFIHIFCFTFFEFRSHFFLRCVWVILLFFLHSRIYFSIFILRVKSILNISIPESCVVLDLLYCTIYLLITVNFVRRPRTFLCLMGFDIKIYTFISK